MPDEYVIPYRVITAEMAAAEAAAAPDEWCSVHSFVDGWGWHNANRRQYLWYRDVRRLLGHDLHPGDGPTCRRDQLEYIYAELQPLLRAEMLARQRLPPPRFDRIVIPKIDIPFPDLRSIFA